MTEYRAYSVKWVEKLEASNNELVDIVEIHIGGIKVLTAKVERLEAALHGIWIDSDMILKGRDPVTDDLLFSTDNTRIIESIRARAALDKEQT